MRYRDAVPGGLILIFRLALVPVSKWAIDWPAVLCLFWIAYVLAPAQGKGRKLGLGMTCAWLAVIYALHQGRWIFAAWN